LAQEGPVMFEGDKRQFDRKAAAALRRSSGTSSGLSYLMIGALMGITVAVAGYLVLHERKTEAKVDDTTRAITVAADRVGNAAEKVASRLTR
jgi:hypothetical protein